MSYPRSNSYPGVGGSVGPQQHLIVNGSTAPSLRNSLTTSLVGMSPGSTTNTKSTQTVFIHKLYDMLNDQSLSHLIWWLPPRNDSFCLLPGEEFSKVLAQYFKHTNIASFIRQLNMYGFHKVNDTFQSEDLGEKEKNELKAAGAAAAAVAAAANAAASTNAGPTSGSASSASSNNANTIGSAISRPSSTSQPQSPSPNSTTAQPSPPVWEFRHSTNQFRKGDVELLKLIKRRSSKNINSHKEIVNLKLIPTSKPDDQYLDYIEQQRQGGVQYQQQQQHHMQQHLQHQHQIHLAAHPQFLPHPHAAPLAMYTGQPASHQQQQQQQAHQQAQQQAQQQAHQQHQSKILQQQQQQQQQQKASPHVDTNYTLVELTNSLQQLRNDYISLHSKYDCLSQEFKKSNMDMIHLIEFIEKIPKQTSQQAVLVQPLQQIQQQQQQQLGLGVPDRSKVKTPVSLAEGDSTTSPLSKSNYSFEYELSKLKLSLLQRSYVNSRNSSSANSQNQSIIPQPYPLNPHYTIHSHPHEVTLNHVKDSKPIERHLSVLMDPLQVPTPSRHNSRTSLLLPEQQQQPPSSQPPAAVSNQAPAPTQLAPPPTSNQPSPFGHQQVKSGLPPIVHPQPSSTPTHPAPAPVQNITPQQPPVSAQQHSTAGQTFKPEPVNSPQIRTYHQYPFPSMHRDEYPPKSSSVEPRTPDQFVKVSDQPPRSIPIHSVPLVGPTDGPLGVQIRLGTNQLPSVSELDQSIKNGNSPVYSLLNSVDRPIIRKARSDEDEMRLKRRRA